MVSTGAGTRITQGELVGINGGRMAGGIYAVF
jgi:hypothetical protein